MFRVAVGRRGGVLPLEDGESCVGTIVRGFVSERREAGSKWIMSGIPGMYRVPTLGRL